MMTKVKGKFIWELSLHTVIDLMSARGALHIFDGALIGEGRSLERVLISKLSKIRIQIFHMRPSIFEKYITFNIDKHI